MTKNQIGYDTAGTSILEVAMSLEDLEKHLLAGVDDQQRGFSRQVDIEGADGQCRASLRYEKFFLATDPRATSEAALLDLIKALQERRYRQLRSRLSFRGKEYFGSLEPWIEYPDIAEPERPRRGLARTLGQFWNRLFDR
ncbi:MAG: hypothetical protein ABJB49_07800 [Nitrospirota bacterium]